MTSSPSSADDQDLTVDERLAAVKAAGRQRRARRHRIRAGLAGVAAFAIVAGIAVLPADDGTPVRTEAADEGPTTTKPTEVLGTVIERDPADATTTTVLDAATPTTSPTETPPPADTRAPVTTVPAGPCQTGPECGEFRWEPAPPPNQPLVLTHDPVGPATVGQPVSIRVRWSDADAQLTFIDDDTDGALLADACAIDRRYGPWAPPAPNGGSGVVTITVTPTEPGFHTVTVFAATGYCDGYDPYHSDATTTIEYEATEPPPAAG